MVSGMLEVVVVVVVVVVVRPSKRQVFNRPGVAGADQQTDLSFIHSLIHLVTESSFSSRSSRNRNFQTVKARELKFCSPPLMRHKSHVMCHM